MLIKLFNFYHKLLYLLDITEMALFQFLINLGSEPMMLGSPTSPKTGVNAQFLPGFLMGDLPAPVTPQPRSISGPSVGVTEMRSPLLAGGSIANSSGVVYQYS